MKLLEQQALEKYKEFKSKCPQITNNDMMLIVDMTMPSHSERLHLYDFHNGIIVDSYFVAHGIGSSKMEHMVADSFSNSKKDRKTSIGAMVTGEIVDSKYGLALEVIGLEVGVNDNVYNRGILIHGAPYSSERYVREHGGCGCSFGGFAVGVDVCDVLINQVKDGVFMYVFGGE